MFGDYSYKMLVKALRVDEIAIGESVWGGGGGGRELRTVGGRGRKRSCKETI